MSSDNGVFREQETVNVTQVYGDLSQEVVHITVDRLKLILHLHAKAIGRRTAWVAPFGILVTIVLVFATSEFRDGFLLKGDTWAAVFLIVAGLCLIWLFRAARAAFQTESVDDLVERIKNQN